jgi:DNA-binding HxlR family transcriptional regulator
MAKINVRVPEPKSEYEVDNQRQINRALRIIVEQLNSTYLKDLKEDTERFSWFMSSGGKC